MPSGESNSTALVPATATIYARVPTHIKYQLDEWAETHGMTLSYAVRHLLELAFTGVDPDPRVTTREARYRMALEAILAVGQLDAHVIARQALLDKSDSPCP